MRNWALSFILLLTIQLSACGGGGGETNDRGFSIITNVSGLNGSLVITVNSSPHTITQNGNVTLPFSFSANSQYSIKIQEQPNNQICNISNGSGIVTDNVFDVLITCGSDKFTISGTVTSTALIVVDSDINDPFAKPNVSNDSTGTAQAINNLSTIHGFASAVGTGNFSNNDRFASTGDIDDYFQVELQANQTIRLQVTDFNTLSPSSVNLNLFLRDSGGVVVLSTNNTEFEEVTVPADDNYFIHVAAAAGVSRYTLVIESINSAHQPLGQTMNFVPNEMIIKFKNNTNSLQATNQHLQIDNAQTEWPMLVKMNSSMTEQILLSSNTSIPAYLTNLKAHHKNDYDKLMTLLEIQRLSERNDIEYVEPNYLYQPLLVPNDTFYNLQWHYPNINLPQAWDITTGDRAPVDGGDVIVAVLDTGVFLSHSDLTGQLVSGYDFISNITNANDGNGIDSNPDDPGDGAQISSSSWHGTHVAGTVAANSNNGQGVAGVSWDAKIMPLRVLGTQGGSSADINQAIRFAARLSNNSGTLPTQVADIINMSLGGPGFSQSTQDAVNAARTAGVIVIAAAGNNNSSQLFYPASYSGVVSVSATDFNNAKAPYSNFGSEVDVAAPGGNQSVDANNDGYGDGVLSTLVNDASGSRGSSFVFYQGTSMAAPHLAGVAALMRAVHPGLSPTDFDNALSSGALTNEAGTTGRDDIFGYGIIDALKAVQEAQRLQNGGTPPTPPALITATPNNLVFGSNSNTTITISNESTTTASITGFTDNTSWLTVATNTVDSNGIGTYNITVDRTGLADSIYNAAITFNISTGSTLEVQVSMIVGAISTTGDIGTTYLLLVDTSTDSTIAQVTPSDQGNGVYSYSFSNIPVGNYQIVGGSDIDNDLLVCQIGENCGGFPSFNTLNDIEVSQDTDNIDFNIDILSSIDSLSVSNDMNKVRKYKIKKEESQTNNIKNFQ